jgi:hypothetical protein
MVYFGKLLATFSWKSTTVLMADVGKDRVRSAKTIASNMQTYMQCQCIDKLMTQK